LTILAAAPSFGAAGFRKREAKAGEAKQMSSLPRRARRWAAIVLGAAAGAGVVAGATGGGDGAATARAAANVTITGRDFFWSPDTVTIQPGDTVTWTNEQGLHNVILGDERLNAPGFPEDPSWQTPVQRTFDTEGSYTYYCEVHPAMAGTINVGEGGPTPTPTPPAPAPPPGGAPPDTTAPTISNLTVTGLNGRATIRLTLSEPATVNVRFAGADEVTTVRAQVQQGTSTIERELPRGRYAYELHAVDAMSNRSSTYPGEVRVRG
jgi:plastocyanin